jgi:hypothetical protein
MDKKRNLPFPAIEGGKDQEGGLALPWLRKI